MRVVSTVLALVVSLVIGGNLLAADEKTAPEGKHQHHPMGQGDVFPGEMLKGLNLTDDQKAKVEALKKEYGPKLKEGWDKAQSILTPDQKTARQDAVKAARAAGKRRAEVREEAQAAVKLTDQQKTKMEQAMKDNQALRKEVHEKLMALLTPEQQTQLKKEMKHRRNRWTEGK